MPSLQVGIPLNVATLVPIFYIFNKKSHLKIKKKSLFFIAVGCIIQVLITGIHFYYNNQIPLKEYLIIFFWIQIALVHFFINDVFPKINHVIFAKWLKLVLFLEIIISIVQKINFLGTNTKLWSIYQYYVSGVNWEAVPQQIALRPIGTIGNPTFFAFAMTALSLLLYKLLKKNIYLVIPFLVYTITLSRGGLLGYVLAILLFIKTRRAWILKTSVLIFVITFISISLNNEILYNFYILPFEDPENYESLAVRIHSIQWAFQENFSLIGNLQNFKLPTAVDLGYSLNFYRYGFFAIFVYLPYFFVFNKKRKSFSDKIIIFITFFNEITIPTFTNILLIQFVILTLSLEEKYYQNENRIYLT